MPLSPGLQAPSTRGRLLLWVGFALSAAVCLRSIPTRTRRLLAEGERRLMQSADLCTEAHTLRATSCSTISRACLARAYSTATSHGCSL
jgi:hypothetical protein